MLFSDRAPLEKFSPVTVPEKAPRIFGHGQGYGHRLRSGTEQAVLQRPARRAGVPERPFAPRPRWHTKTYLRSPGEARWLRCR